MNRHPINRPIRDAEAALFDLYATPQRGRIRGWIARALEALTGAFAAVGFFYAAFFLAFAFGG